MFVDRVTVHMRAGSGGAGVVSFRKRRGSPKGKPDGGSGGAGGDVVLRASVGMTTLFTYQRHPHHRAGDGSRGERDLRHGRAGNELVLRVPLGTVVRDSAGVVIADLVRDGEEFPVVLGGRGGRGNASFVAPARRAPGFSERGEPGDEESFELELKLVADAALIGFPNAGKSTLIASVTAARPKIADYPFTTLQPNLGVVVVDDREFVLADIPGLIEGASEGKGLGKEFLRHVERARALVLLLDPSVIQDLDPVSQHDSLLRELDAYLPDLLDRPRLVALSKADTIDDSVSVAEQVRAATGQGVFVTSGVQGAGLDALVHAVADAVETSEREAPERAGFVLHRPALEPFTVERSGAVWIVGGKLAERAVSLADLTMPEAADFVAARLTTLGVDDALRKAGAVPGATVRIGEMEFEFWDEDFLPPG